MKVNNAPRFMICDPLPSESEKWPLEYVLCTEPASLWGFDDDGNGSLIESYQPIPPASAATLAREVGDWLVQHHTEEDNL